MSRTLPTLQPFYYLDHFLETIEFLERHYAGILDQPELQYLEDFRQLDKQAKGLKVRITNRRGQTLRRSHLRYPEILDLEKSLADLVAAGFIRMATAADSETLLSALTREELLALVRTTSEPTKGLSSKPKAKLLRLAKLSCNQMTIDSLGLPSQFIVKERSETLAFMLYLYFGKGREGLQAFALRDLGIVKTRANQKQFELRFSDRRVALAMFHYTTLAATISEGDESRLEELSSEVCDWPTTDDDAAEASRHREISRLGNRLEKLGKNDLAIKVYHNSDQHPARERRCRLLYAAGHSEPAKLLLEEMLIRPSADEELLFAEDFYARKFGKRTISRLTAMLRDAPVIKLDEAFRDGAERAAANYFFARGSQSYRCENHFWNVLFGVMFWEELKADCGGLTANEFELRPTQLINGTFAKTQQTAIAERLKTLGTGSDLQHLARIFNTRFGTPNGIFRWRRSDQAMLQNFLEIAPAAATAEILLRMAQNLKKNSRGYPDLMVIENGEVRFLEVKAEGDQIRRHQLVQIEALQQAGFSVGIIRVEWCVDPNQEYAVVDIETTGGRSDSHRITEIGAVKVKNGEVIDRFHTLINPERRIPWNIVRLTGISDEMVAAAPMFSEIAESLRSFIGETVFVAHSAKFDHGFIRAEFERLGERFRRPTLCTVVAMRKFFPGLQSYKLSELCREFSIPLESHHRAMCDANATAELLKLINTRRLESQARP